MPIIVKVNVLKLDKSKFFKGDKGTYVDLILLENRDGEDEYGNSHMVVQGVTKEDREAGVKGAIVGNAKTIGGGSRKPAPQRESKHSYHRDDDPSEENRIPF